MDEEGRVGRRREPRCFQRNCRAVRAAQPGSLGTISSLRNGDRPYCRNAHGRFSGPHNAGAWGGLLGWWLHLTMDIVCFRLPLQRVGAICREDAVAPWLADALRLLFELRDWSSSRSPRCNAAVRVVLHCLFRFEVL